jgi:3-oxoacyl-[acyl-carrier protein] reductase
MYSIDLEGKRILLTGCEGGLGQVMLKLLTEANAEVVLTDIVKPERSIRYLESLGKKGHWYQCDLADQDAVDTMFAKMAEDLDSIDILINNAGIIRDALLVKMTVQDWDSVIDINLKGIFLCTQASVKLMLKRKTPHAKIISISSIAGLFGNPGQTNYAAAKAGLIAMTKTWTKEYGRRGMTFNVVAPGLIESPMTDGLPEKDVRRFKDAIPLGVLGKPADVAKVVLFLCSDLSNYVNGEVIRVDGGAVI